MPDAVNLRYRREVISQFGPSHIWWYQQFPPATSGCRNRGFALRLNADYMIKPVCVARLLVRFWTLIKKSVIEISKSGRKLINTDATDPSYLLIRDGNWLFCCIRRMFMLYDTIQGVIQYSKNWSTLINGMSDHAAINGNYIQQCNARA